MKIKIKKAKLEELKRIVSVTNKAFDDPFDPKGYIRKDSEYYKDLVVPFKNKKFGIFVAVYNNKIIGVQRFEFIRNNINLFRLGVLKSFRNKGVAPALIKRTESEGKKKNCKKITLMCIKEKGLVSYYKKIGFRVDKIKKHRDHHDVFMSKSIN